MNTPSPEAPTLDDLLRAAGLMTLGGDPPLDAIEQALPDETAERWRTYGPPIVDIVSTPEGPRYLVARPGEGIGLEEKLEGREPWPSAALPWPAIPDAGEVIFALEAGAEAPVEELRELISNRVVLPEPVGAWASLLAAWVLATYVLGALPYFPLILLEGPAERGKSRLAKALAWLAFRGVLLISTSPAMLVRDRAWHRVTAVIDVEDLPGVIKRGDYLGDLLLASYEKDGQVRRCVRPDAEPPNQADSLPAYGACIVTSNRPIRDDSPLASRCIRVPLPEAGGRLVPDALSPAEALPLRARAVAWAARLAADGIELPSVEIPFRGRARDLALPLLRVLALVAPGEVEGVTQLLGRVDADRRAEASRSWEGQVAVALWAARDRVEAGRLYVRDLTDAVNEGLDDDDPARLSVQQAGVARRSLCLRGGKGGSPPRAYLLWPGDETAQALHDRYSQAALDAPEGSEGSTGNTRLPTNPQVGRVGRVGSEETPCKTDIPSDASDASVYPGAPPEGGRGSVLPPSFDLWTGGPAEPGGDGPVEPRPGVEI